MVTCGYLRRQTPPRSRIAAIVLSVKGWILRITVCLVLGVITTIAVAWGCAVWSEATFGRMGTQVATEATLDFLRRAGWEPRQTTTDWGYTHSIQEWRGFGASDWFVIETAVQQQTSNLLINGMFNFDFCIAHISRFGWPLRSLVGGHLDPAGNGVGATTWLSPWRPRARGNVGANPIDRRTQTPMLKWQYSMSVAVPKKLGPLRLPADRRLPVHPIWIGFIIDSIFYAAILWILTLNAALLNRYRRLVRGRCPNCGYDLRGDSGGGCSECGWQR